MHTAVLIGSAIIVVLGVAHAVFTLRSSPNGGPMMPTDSKVRDAMQIPGGIGLAPDVSNTLFDAWIGFNLSHAIAVIGTGLIIGVPAMMDFTAALARPWWVAVAVLLPVIYVVLARLYWFDKVVRAVGVSAFLIVGGVVGGLVT